MFASSKTLRSLQKRLFQLLIFLLPTQLALHFWPDWSLMFGIRVDYLSPAIYLTDIVLLSLVFVWVVSKPKIQKIKLSSGTIFSACFIALFVFFNTFLSRVPQAALYKWVKFLFFSFLFLFLNTSEGFKKETWLIKPLKYSLAFFSLIGIVQFVLQRTIGGPLYFLGERSFTSQTPGIALYDLFGREYLRAYSTFSHPNSFAAFLVASLALLYFNKKDFKKLDIVAMSLSAIALLLSFSRAAIFVMAFLLAIRLMRKVWDAEDKILPTLLTAGILASIAGPVASSGLLERYDFGESIRKRLSLTTASGELFTQRPGTGVGLNNFIINLPKTSLDPSYSWDLQPSHNIFLLTLSETGIVGLLLLYLLFKKTIKEGGRELKYAITAFVLTGLVDHHWLTLQQNLLLFFLILCLSLSSKKG